ncbi:sensor histidine kinase [Actinomadura scrupuli]|uniref:sensor histidine kinase n=1 Tax=Actinomadura scrupuli TaxID=559629 RepID=UPI003D96129C
MSPRIAHLHCWSRSHLTVLDGLVALALFVVALPQLLSARSPGAGFSKPDATMVAIVAVVMMALAFRQRFPVAVLLVVVGGNVLITALRYGPTVAEVLAFVIAVYTIAAHRALAVSSICGALALVSFTVMELASPGDMSSVAVVTNAALIAGVWWLGRSLRLRRAYLAELEYRAERLERARDSDARTARVEERSRIARELHDVVAHHVSVMTVQAGAARRILDKDPDSAREAMTTIEEVGRTTLDEMRRIVGVLRTERDTRAAGPELSPQPGVQEVGALVDHVRETGLSVQLWMEGEPRPLSTGVNLAAYRLIQEALTNSLKHAGPQARAWVRIHYGPRELMVEIEDDGRGVAAALADNGDGPGHGLVGMRERVALYGGELRIGPRSGGGFEVRARFPLD